MTNKSKIVGIGHNQNSVTDKLLNIRKTLEETFSSLNKNYSKYNAAMGDTYSFFAGGVDDVEVRKGTRFDRNQLHFEAQKEQAECIKKICPLIADLDKELNDKKWSSKTKR